MARKPDLPGAADFFQSSDKSQTTTDEVADEDSSEDKSAGTSTSADQLVQDTESGSQDSPAKTDNRQEGPAQQTLTPAMESLSTESPRKIEQPPTEKVTFYLPARMLEELEVCRVRLLTEYNLKVNRSQITQAALALTLDRPDLLEDALLQLDELARELQESE